ncbi:MAG: hypothetical protein WAR22_07125 [Desulfomonilia bacterium]
MWIFKVDSTGALRCGMDADTYAIEDDTASVTITDTIGSSAMETASAVVNATDCSAFHAAPDVFTQCSEEE